MTGTHPRLRSHTRRRKSGKVVTYYVYDRRQEGKPDIPLGRDYDKAIQKWDEIHNRAPRIAGTLEEAFSAWEQSVLPTHKAVTRADYTKWLRHIRAVFAEATWDGVALKDLKGYLQARTAKTQGNRELSLLAVIWNWARVEGYTALPWPAHGMERSRWKNPESARAFRPTPELFAAVYAEGDQVVRDCMDIATATGMRLTDCRTIPMPHGDMLRLKASKTGKEADFDITRSPVLTEIVARRRAMKVTHLKLLTTPTGREVSYGMLRDRWDAARAKAAATARARADGEFAALIELMYLRDMRKLASRLTGSTAAAAELLQHDDPRLTAKHYPVPVVLRTTR